MNYSDELTVLNAILNYKIPEIPEDTRFWMIRTCLLYTSDAADE